MPQLSVVIITFNEEKNIERCLNSVQGVADDIVVVDSFSSDATPEICKKFNAHFTQCKWEGYAATKNFANSIAKNDWILSLDADEALSPALKNSILELKKKTEPTFAQFNRLTNYCGKWIKHCGWYPDKKLRLFDRRTTKWEGSIHEDLIIHPTPTIIHIQGDCLHYSYYTVEEHLKQTEKFSTLSAEDLFKKGKKVNIVKMYFSPVAKFLQTYFIQLGFLDGYYGYRVCRISASATFLKYKKLSNLYPR